jgi:arabinofuranosyltransferase
MSGAAPGKASGAPSLPVLCSLAAFLVQVVLYWPYTMDDSFISFRYAKHIGDGLGPIWNLMDPNPPVEGFTSFLQVWLLGFIRFLTAADTELTGKLLGVFAGLALALAAVLETRRSGLRGGPLWVALSFLWLPFVALNSVNGMETALALLWTFLTMFAAARLAGDPSSSTAAFVLYGLLGTLTRPEFAMAFGLMALYVWWRAPLVRPALVKYLALFYVLPGVLVTLGRLWYFGDVVPNAFYVKQKKGLSAEGVQYVLTFLGFCALPYLLLIANGWRSLWAQHRHLVSVVLINLAASCVYFSTTMPLMGWWYRFLLSYVPPLAFCAALALRESAGRFPALRPAAAALLVVLPAAQLPNVAQFITMHKAHENLYREVGKRMRPLAARDRWLYFYDVGSLVYESEWNTIDQVALNTHRRRLRSVCIMAPDVMLQAGSGSELETSHCDGLLVLLTDLPFLDQGPAGEKYMRVYVRRDLTYKDELKKRLQDHWPGPFRRRADWLVAYGRKTEFFGAH